MTLIKINTICNDIITGITIFCIKNDKNRNSNNTTHMVEPHCINVLHLFLKIEFRRTEKDQWP